MRLLVFFDLPVGTKKERKHAADFRKFLIRDGYYMVQFSVYARICNGADAAAKHEERLKFNLPPKGSIRLMVVTEKQYENTRVLLGKWTPQEKKYAVTGEQLSFF